EKDEEA
ncbi:hypothetical protein AB3S75_016385, partial [Citrus x aurantiifolia]